MLKELIEDLKARKKYKDAFAAAYNKGERGSTLPQILKDAEVLAKKLGKVKDTDTN